MYHGTETERGRRILSRQKMEYSRGENEWLGDGIYLYRDKILAYRWIKIQYKSNFHVYSFDKLFEHYMILGVTIDYDAERVFSLLKPEHQVEYYKIKEECKKKAGLSKKMAGYDFTDGVVLNFMFKKMGYDKKYDMVEAVFPIDSDADEKSRLGTMSEYQLCVKNPEKIVSIYDCTGEFKTEDYESKLRTINKYRTIYNKDNTKYAIEYGEKNYGKI